MPNILAHCGLQLRGFVAGKAVCLRFTTQHIGIIVVVLCVTGVHRVYIAGNFVQGRLLATEIGARRRLKCH